MVREPSCATKSKISAYESTHNKVLLDSHHHSILFTVCDGSAGIEFGWVIDSRMSASTEKEYAPANRARLNAVTLAPIVSGLSEGFSGGWRPLDDDPEPWIQVELLIIKRLVRLDKSSIDVYYLSSDSSIRLQ